MSDPLWPHRLQHARLLCPLSPRVCSNSCPLSLWCHLTISSFAAPVSFCLQSFPAPGPFPVSQLFASGGQSTGIQHQSFQWIFRIQFTCSVMSLCDPMDCHTPGFPVHHQLPEFTQTHGHRVGDVIQPSHPLSSPSPPAFNLSQHPGLFQWVSSSHQVAKVLKFQLQHQSFQCIFRTDFL